MTDGDWPGVLIRPGPKPTHRVSATVPTPARDEPAVIRARLRMVLPGGLWVNEVSTSFPEATLRLLTGVPKGDHALELSEVRAGDPRSVADAIRTHPDVAAYEELYAGDERVIAQYEADERALYEFLWASSLPPSSYWSRTARWSSR